MTAKSRGSGGEKGRGEGGWVVIVDGSEDLLTRRRHKTKATMQILQKQQFTDDNLRQVTSQPEASVTHPHPLLVLGPSWAPAATCPPTRCVCVFYVNEFIYYYFIFCHLLPLVVVVVLLRILWHCRHFQLAYPTLPACLAFPPPSLTTSCQLHNAEN